MINGMSYAWEDTTINFPWGLALDIQEISYGDKKPVKPIFGKGGVARRYGKGNYEATCKFKVLREELLRFIALAAETGVPLYNLPPAPITVIYANEDEPLTTDTILVKVSSLDTSAKQGGESTEVDIETVVLAPILWNGVPAAVGM